MDGLIINSKPEVGPMVEVTRSFSYKLNVGNYESRDFFCSQKAECRSEDAERVSEAVHDFCKRQVMRAVNQFIEDSRVRKEPVRTTLAELGIQQGKAS